MIGQLRNSIVTKIIWGLMGLYFLNISVDAPDPFPEHISEDLTINDQESIIEIVLEKILGYENAVPEHDDNDVEDHTQKTNFKIDVITHYTFDSSIKPIFITTTKQKYSDQNTYLTNGFQKLDTPPPKI